MATWPAMPAVPEGVRGAGGVLRFVDEPEETPA
ncbi:hypothetical protein MBT84_48000 [Streptomyces sp. MBT84]|nr:hypothetical protein [Streptomyces sp. MBT84]